MDMDYLRCFIEFIAKGVKYIISLNESLGRFKVVPFAAKVALYLLLFWPDNRKPRASLVVA